MKKIFSLLFITALISNMAIANGLGGFDAGSVGRQNELDLRLHEIEKRGKKNTDAFITTRTTPQSQTQKQEQQISSSPIKSVVFLNNSSIASSELAYAVRDQINAPMTVENISLMRKEIMKYYQDRGYFSAVATMVSQDTQTGQVIFDIKEGGKNSIQIDY